MQKRNKNIIPFFVLLMLMIAIFLGVVYLFLSEEKQEVVKRKILGKEVVLPEKESSDFLAERQLCQEQKDCVPLPGCHPKECINKKFERDFSQPKECTLIFESTAAYEEKDCICQKGRCVNKNANNK